MTDPDSNLPAEQWSVESSDFGRIVSISDGVFAFALTLLAVNITLPALNSATAANDLPQALWELREPFFIYMLAFFTVYLKWNMHRRLFRVLKQYDNRLLGLDMFFLLLIATLSLPANVIGKYGDIPSRSFFRGLSSANHIHRRNHVDLCHPSSPSRRAKVIRRMDWREWSAYLARHAAVRTLHTARAVEYGRGGI